MEMPIGFGEFLTNEYEILRRVFSFLSVTDLINCMKICKPWNNAALATIREKRGIQCLILTEEVCQPFVMSDAALVLRFRTLPDDGKCVDPTNVLAEETVDLVTNYGVVAEVKNSRPISRRYRVELSVSVPLVQATVRFSPMSGISIKTATFPLNKVFTEEEIEAIFCIPDGALIKTVLFISYEDSTSAYDTNGIMGPRILQFLYKKSDGFALGGCRCPVIDNEAECLKVVIFMGPSIETSSCVLDSSCRSNKSIRAKVEQLKDSVTPSKDSVILVFRCCDRTKVKRRYNYQPSQNVLSWESNAFKEYFPDTPAVGCYGIGEYGNNFPSLETNLKKPRLTYDFAFSTVLVYIGIRNPTT